MTGELSRGNELFNAFWQESGWLQPLSQGDMLQHGKELHHIFLKKLWQDEGNTRRDIWEQAEILHRRKWL